MRRENTGKSIEEERGSRKKKKGERAGDEAGTEGASNNEEMDEARQQLERGERVDGSERSRSRCCSERRRE